MNAAHIKAGRARRPLTLLGCMGRALVISLAIFLALTLLAAWLAYQQSDPLSAMRPLSYAVMLLSFLLVGWVAARLRGRQFLISGILGGVAMAAVLSVLMLALCGEHTLDGSRLLLTYPIGIALSALGGLLGSVRRERRIRRHA